MNNNLIIFYKDNSKDVFSFDLDTDEKSALEFFQKMRPKVNKNDIVKYFYAKEDDVTVDIYAKHAELSEEKEIKINLRSMIIAERVKEIRKKRNAVISNLDVPFMKSLEESDPKVKNQIVAMKDFLRDLPSTLNFKDLTEEEILQHNPFGNIFEIILLESAEDYIVPPKITIDPPKMGNQAKALSFIKDGKISRIEVVDYGNGYDFIPHVRIESSVSEKKSFAVCGYPQNCFLIEDKIWENTEEHYRDS